MEKVEVKCNYLTYGFIALLDYRSQPIMNMTQEQKQQYSFITQKAKHCLEPFVKFLVKWYLLTLWAKFI